MCCRCSFAYSSLPWRRVSKVSCISINLRKRRFQLMIMSLDDGRLELTLFPVDGEGSPVGLYSSDLYRQWTKRSARLRLPQRSIISGTIGKKVDLGRAARADICSTLSLLPLGYGGWIASLYMIIWKAEKRNSSSSITAKAARLEFPPEWILKTKLVTSAFKCVARS